MRCEEVREVIPAYTRDGDAGLPVRRHLSDCHDCSQELARYETLYRSLQHLKSETATPPPELFHQLAAIPYQRSRADEVRGHVAHHRNRYALGLGAAVLGATGAALWRSRRGRVATA